MSFSQQLDHERAEIMRRVREARNRWAEAMRAHHMAPPDAGFAGRLRALADAATIEQVTWEQAHGAGLLWRPVPGAENVPPPYELRPGTGRRGPQELWAKFDAAVAHLNHAITQPSAAVVSEAFGEVADLAAGLAEAVAQEDRSAPADARPEAVQSATTAAAPPAPQTGADSDERLRGAA